MFPSKWKYLGTGFFFVPCEFVLSVNLVTLCEVQEKNHCSAVYVFNRTFLEFYVNVAKTFYNAKGETLFRYTFLLKAPNLSPDITFQKLPNNAPNRFKTPHSPAFQLLKTGKFKFPPPGPKGRSNSYPNKPKCLPSRTNFSFNPSLFVL